MPDPLEAAIRALLPPGVALAVWEGDEAPALHPDEIPFVARAFAPRVADFSRGRACARAALAQLGAEPGPILVDAHRAPVWPAGFVGSITHCQGFVAAVAARTETVIALGLDAEPDGPLPDGTEAHILHPLDPRGDHGALDKVVFSAKESIFKAIHPLTGVWLDFRQVVLEIDESARGFTAAPAPDAPGAPPELARLRGRYARVGGLALAAAFIEAVAPSPAP